MALRNGVNPSKTELILSTRKLKIEGFKSLTFCGKTLALSNQVKYLGVLLDSLNFHGKTMLKQNAIKHWKLFIKYAPHGEGPPRWCTGYTQR